jgi:hypothetical protein
MKQHILNGITIQPAKLNIKVSKGAPKNIILFDFLGIMISFNKAFNPSASGCNKPQIPTTLGPRLR